MPVVSREGKFVFAQLIKDVVKFLDIKEDVGPKLSPAELVERADFIWESAIRYCKQMPDTSLDKELPNRPRSYRVLMHHIFQVPTCFLEARTSGDVMSYERLVAPPPEGCETSNGIAQFGENLRAEFAAWAKNEGEKLGQGKMPTYYGEQPTHEVLERTVWHSTQHVRQVMSLLEREGVKVDQPLGKDAIAGLPLTDKVWDD